MLEQERHAAEMTKLKKKRTFLRPLSATLPHSLRSWMALMQAKPSLRGGRWPPAFLGKAGAACAAETLLQKRTMQTQGAGCGLSAVSLLALCTLDSHPSAKTLSPTRRRGSQAAPHLPGLSLRKCPGCGGPGKAVRVINKAIFQVFS